ncbi:MAG TPA: glycosyltransferase family 2 protein [Blastocatellia bacterium]|nr:glycosyltransferase family 2 protein [Blastocatellia bacterium]
MYRGQTVAVVMPIHNEQDHIELAVSRVPDFVDLIVAVDDGSADATWERLCAIRDRRLARVRHSSNRGVGAATRTGYKFALEARAELIAVMDGDGQMDGRDLPALLDCAIGGADYVKGNRFLHRETIDCMPRARFIGNLVFSWLMRRASSFEQSLDAQCGYTVIRAESLRKLDLESLYDRYGFLNEMFFAARLAGLKVRSIPVRAVYGSELSGINPLTAVPTILYLIGRSYLRWKSSRNGVEPVFGIQQAESESVR